MSWMNPGSLLVSEYALVSACRSAIAKMQSYSSCSFTQFSKAPI